MRLEVLGHTRVAWLWASPEVSSEWEKVDAAL
jgi:hypothetical protein